jgi:hypothetical protein
MVIIKNIALERTVLELTVLYEISQLLISYSEPKEVLGSILDILHSEMGMATPPQTTSPRTS